METYISVVSHGHGRIIKTLNCLSQLSRLENVSIVVRDNVGEDDLQAYCRDCGVNYIRNVDRCGFARNNNLNFQWLKDNFSIDINDCLLILNPDVDMAAEEFSRFSAFMERSEEKLVSIIQYADAGKLVVEPAVRKFSSPLRVVAERLTGKRPVARPNQGLDDTFDWCSGAFLAVRCSLYESIGGFSESYFMYYEDADFCLRCKRQGVNLVVNTDISAIHYAQYANRRIFSRMFFASLRSYIRFLFVYVRYCLEKRL